MISLKNITKLYNSTNGVQNIDLTLKNNSITGLIGKNGAGKTTLMKIICENIQNYKGEIYKDTNKNIGYLIESPKMYMGKSGRYNIKYFSKVLKVNDKNYVKELIEVLETESFLDKKVKNYSMGMKQRLGVLLAMLDKPNYLILDEPTNGMDPDSSLDILTKIKKLSEKENIGILISSHKLEEIELICQEVIFLDNGVITGRKQIEDLESTRSTLLYFKKEDLNSVSSILSEYNIEIHEHQNCIEVFKENKISELLRLLSNNDLFPDEVKENKKNLKDYYFSMTKGGKN